MAIREEVVDYQLVKYKLLERNQKMLELVSEELSLENDNFLPLRDLLELISDNIRAIRQLPQY